MQLTATGNLSFFSEQSSIQFPNPSINPKPMIMMFSNNTENINRMVIAHSAAFPNFGLQYNDVADRFDFLSAGSSVFNINLGNVGVGVNAGNLSFSSDQSSIQFPNPGSTPKPMMFMFNSGTANPNRMIIAHSFAIPDFGLRYNDVADHVEFVGGTKIPFRVSLNTGRIGVGSSSPVVDLHIFHGNGDGTNHGLRLQNSGLNNKHWTFYTADGGFMELWANNNIRGVYDPVSGVYSVISDARRKKDIEKAPDLLDKVMQLDIKKYHLLENKPVDKKQYGMIAQDVEKIFPEVVCHKIMDSSRRDLYTVNYGAFGVIALKAIQEQQQKIAEQEKNNKAQQEKISTLEERIAKLEAMLHHSNVGAAKSNNVMTKEINDGTLEQNQPNPFSENTIIRYHLLQGNTGQINLYDATGALMKSFKAIGSGQLNINGNDLKAGAYTYNLIANGQMVSSKKLVVVK